MPTVRLSSKGQLVIPKEFREKLGLSPGDGVNVQLEDKRLVIQPATHPPSEVFAKAGSRIVDEALQGSEARDEEKIRKLLMALGAES